jgi:hypothetical protein
VQGAYNRYDRLDPYAAARVDRNLDAVAVLADAAPAEESAGDVSGGTSSIESLFPAVGKIDAASSGAPAASKSASDGSGYGDSGYGGGFKWSIWGWLSYLRTPQQDRSTFWAYEFELGLTKSFSQEIAATVEFDYMDIPDNELYIEQMFISFMFPQFDETILTAGKFNAPFGAEPRDFWNRVSASRSLLFRRQPQDLVGLMLTHRIGETDVYLRPMLVNGYFAETGFDNNEEPSLALMVEYKPTDDLSIAGTYWHGPELDDNVSDKLQFVDAHIRWNLTDAFSVAGEYQFGTTRSPTGPLDWYGYLALANYDFSDQFRVFVQWSLLNDRDGFQTGRVEQADEINVGFGWYIHSMVELRAEYRHDYRPAQGDLDHWDAHLAFGY